MRPQLEEAALRQRIEAIVAYLKRPDRSAHAQVLLADPLSLSGDLLKPLAGLTKQAHEVEGQLTWHQDGQSAMVVLQVPFAPSDSRRTGPLLDDLDAVIAQAAQRGVHMDYVGSYRHFRDNNQSIHHTLILTIPLSLLLIGIALWSLFRSAQALALLHIPIAAAAIGSAIALSLGSGFHIPLIVLGFGSCIVGIAIDYGIHMTHAALDGHARRVIRPIMISAATTGCAMLALLFSDIPIIHNLGYLLVGGIAAACLAACDLVPRLIKPQPQQPLGWSRLSDGIERWMRRANPKRLMLAGLITAILIPGLWQLRFISDLKQMDGSSAETTASLMAFEQRWGFFHNADFLVGQGSTLDETLRRLRISREAAGLPISPIELLLPDLKQQARNLTAWNTFWQQEAPGFQQRLEHICAELGIRSSAFQTALNSYLPCAAQPSKQSTRPIPALVTLHTWDNTPLADLFDSSIQ